MSGRTTGPLFAHERQEAIVRELGATGRVELSALARRLDVSGETVRKDLAALESRGLLQRVHGGAVPVDSLTLEPAVETRTERRAEKLAIARAALVHAPAGGSMLVDAGSTTSVLADLLPTDRALTVYTNALVIAASLAARPNLEVRTVGGLLRPATMAVVGEQAVDALRGVNVDVAFLGTNGLSLERGLTTPDAGEAAVKAAMVQAAGRRVVLADSSKLGLVSQCRHCRLEDVDLLVTDAGAPPATVEQIRGHGVEVEVVEAAGKDGHP